MGDVASWSHSPCCKSDGQARCSDVGSMGLEREERKRTSSLSLPSPATTLQCPASFPKSGYPALVPESVDGGSQQRERMVSRRRLPSPPCASVPRCSHPHHGHSRPSPFRTGSQERLQRAGFHRGKSAHSPCDSKGVCRSGKHSHLPLVSPRTLLPCAAQRSTQSCLQLRGLEQVSEPRQGLPPHLWGLGRSQLTPVALAQQVLPDSLKTVLVWMIKCTVSLDSL